MFSLTFLCLAAFLSYAYTTTPIGLEDRFKLASAVGTLSQKLYRQIVVQDKSYVYSPYSIHSAFTLASLGTRKDTLTEMWQVLGTANIGQLLQTERSVMSMMATAQNATADVGNALFFNPDFTVKPDYIKDAINGFHARVDYLDFGAKEGPEYRINDFVRKETHDLIKEAVPANTITRDAAVVLVNTVYFNATWKTKFDPGMTYDSDFHRTDGSVSKVKMMGFEHPVTVALRHDNDAEIDTLELPYVGDQFAFSIVLPRNAKAMARLESSQANLEKAVANLDKLTVTANTHVQIPKFKTSTKINLKSVMSNLGMKKVFTPGQADFSGMTDNQVYISDASHQAVIDVAEDGTEAAAVTTITISYTSVPVIEDMFLANKPFLYFLRDKVTGQILFQGKFVGDSE